MAKLANKEKLRREQVLNLYNDRKSKAWDIYKFYFSKLLKRFAAYRGLYSGQFKGYRNVIWVPYIFTIVQADVARKIGALLGTWPYVEFMPLDADGGPQARRLSKLISMQADEAEIFDKLVDVLLCADLYGTGIVRDGWVEEVRKQRIRVGEPLLTGEVLEAVVERDYRVFDGPTFQNVDLPDFIPEPGKKRVSEMKWAMQNWTGDYEELLARAAAGEFDEDAVKDISTLGGSGEDAQRMLYERSGLYSTPGDYKRRIETSYDKPVAMTDMIGWLPAELTPDGYEWRLLTVANDRVIVKDIPMPWLHGELPFYAVTPMADPHYFHGVGKAEVAEKLHYLACKYASQKADALDQAIDPAWLINKLVNIDTENLITRAGRVTLVEGSVGEENIRPLMPDMRGLQMVYPELVQIFRHIQMATGMEESTLMGMPGPARETARGFLGRQESALTRQVLEAKAIEKQLMEKMWVRWRKLNQQFLRVPKEMALIGSSYAYDQLTGLPMPSERALITMDDITKEYPCRAVGASMMLGRSIKQANAMGLMNVMGANPVLVQAINWISFGKFVFELFDMPNTNDFFVEKIPALNLLAAAGQMRPTELVNRLDQAGMGEMQPGGMGQLGQLGQRAMEMFPTEMGEA